jgi:hypothetical protein
LKDVFRNIDNHGSMIPCYEALLPAIQYNPEANLAPSKPIMSDQTLGNVSKVTPIPGTYLYYQYGTL